MPVVELVRELWVYSIQGRCMVQEARLLAAMQCRVASRSWIARSVWPFVWGWKPDKRLFNAPRAWQKDFHTC